MFIGRTTEKKEILEHLNNNRFEYLLVYGMRRVGKTKLINECLKSVNAKVISYTFRDVLSEINKKEFIEFLPSCFNEPYLSFTDLNKALVYLCEKAKTQKIILFIDEYPFLRRDDGGIDSYFQEIKNMFEDLSNLKIIFCGSYTNVMLKMIDAAAPLYGRFSYILNLAPFDYYEASLFMNNLSNLDKFKYYACFGGLGFTLSNLDFQKSFEENLKDLFIKPDSLFEREVFSIVNQEINKIPEAKYLLELIGTGTNKYSDISLAFSRQGESKNVAYLLNKLQEIDLIEKVSIINEKKMKNDLYVIKDNLLCFYFKYLSKTLSIRSNTSLDTFYSMIKDDLDKAYFPKKFEDVSKQFLIKLNKSNLISNPFSLIGRLIYHDKIKKENGEFDIVLKDSFGYIDIECKFLNRKINQKDYEEEKEKLKELNLDISRVGFISKLGFDESFPKEVIHYQLDDFYQLFKI